MYKRQGVFNSLTSDNALQSITEGSELGVSSLMDTWLLLRNVEHSGERNRTIFVQKSRGMAHSNQVREFVLSDKGIDLVDVHLSGDRVLTGRARIAQEARERVDLTTRHDGHQRTLRQLESKQKTIDAQIAALQAEAETVQLNIMQESLRGDSDGQKAQQT